ncbi:MAG TPA: helix-turn-helix transcriptional regulator [Jiangellaceae bacterium]|nr:helix-turn-helix transcriptional regulator [Jiangellaceae bacterium]
MTEAKRVDPLVRLLWKRRIVTGRTLADVAKASGLSKTMLCESENGHHVPGLASVHRWAAALDYRVELIEVRANTGSEEAPT